MALLIGALLIGLDIVTIPDQVMSSLPSGVAQAIRTIDDGVGNMRDYIVAAARGTSEGGSPSSSGGGASPSGAGEGGIISPTSAAPAAPSSTAYEGFDFSAQQSPPDRPIPPINPDSMGADAAGSTVFGLSGDFSWDEDGDGLSNSFEKWAADAFFPYLYFDDDEPADVDREILRLYQVTPVRDSSGLFYQGPDGVLLTFVIAYKKDYGIKAEMPDVSFPVWGGWVPMPDFDFFIAGHPGDTETVRIVIVNPPGESNLWRPAAVLIKRHYDPWHAYYPGEFERSGSHIKLWVSGGKHAMYLSKDECESYHVTNFEVCGGGDSLTSPVREGVDGFNVGEHLGHLFETIPTNSLHLFENEEVWSGERFCGGQTVSDRDHCAGDLDGKWWPPSDITERHAQGRELASFATRQYLAWFGGRYEVTFSTGEIYQAGTDLDVDLTLRGDREFTEVDLDTPNHDDFERGQADTFQIGVYDLGYLHSVRVKVYYPHASGQPSNSEWFLDSILVHAPEGVCYEFECNCWLDWDNGYDDTIEQNTRNEVTIPLSNAYYCIDF
jgi:hypothetical protein